MYIYICKVNCKNLAWHKCVCVHVQICTQISFAGLRWITEIWCKNCRFLLPSMMMMIMIYMYSFDIYMKYVHMIEGFSPISNSCVYASSSSLAAAVGYCIGFLPRLLYYSLLTIRRRFDAFSAHIMLLTSILYNICHSCASNNCFFWCHKNDWCFFPNK